MKITEERRYEKLSPLNKDLKIIKKLKEYVVFCILLNLAWLPYSSAMERLNQVHERPASRYGDRMLQRLLGEVDVNALDSSGHTALHYVLEKLYDIFTNVSPLASTRAQLIAIARTLMKAGAKVDPLDTKENTVLILSFMRGFPDIGQDLMSAGAHPKGFEPGYEELSLQIFDK